MTDPSEYAAAYQGAPGAFSEDAARAFVGDQAALLPCWKFEDVFLAVESGRAAYGVLPSRTRSRGPYRPRTTCSPSAASPSWARP